MQTLPSKRSRSPKRGGRLPKTPLPVRPAEGPAVKKAIRILRLALEAAFVAWVLGIGWHFYSEMGFGQLLMQLFGGQG